MLDDVLSALDVRTEKVIIERLLGKTGILRQLSSTVILATQTGENCAPIVFINLLTPVRYSSTSPSF